MSDTIIVTGHIDFDPANRDGIIAAALEMMEATHAEEGNEGYTFSSDLADPGRLHLSEQWASRQAMDEHGASAHMAAFMGKLGGLGVKGAKITKWEGATGSPLM